MLRPHLGNLDLRYIRYLKSNTAKLIAFGVFTRLLLLLIGYLSYASSSNPNEQYVAFDFAYVRQEIVSFSRGDSQWYMDIAQNGYEHGPFSTDKHANWAFYPLWPVLLRLSSLVISNMLVAGIIVSTLLFLLAVTILYKLISMDFHQDIAMMTAILVMIFPSAYFGSRPGPEALFLLLVVSSLYCAKKNQWLSAGILGGLATLTRVQGILLGLPLLYIYYRQYRLSRMHNVRVLSLLMIPAALMSLMLYMYWLTGNMFASFAMQGVWDNNFSFPFAAMIQFLSQPHIIHYYGWDLSLISFVFLFASAVLTVVMATKPTIPREYLLYTILSICLLISRNTMEATLRLMLLVFPLHLALALFLQNRKTTFSLAVFTMGAIQVFYFIGFIYQYNWANT